MFVRKASKRLGLHLLLPASAQLLDSDLRAIRPACNAQRRRRILLTLKEDLGGVHAIEKERIHLKPCKEKAHPVQAWLHGENECV